MSLNSAEVFAKKSRVKTRSKKSNPLKRSRMILVFRQFEYLIVLTSPFESLDIPRTGIMFKNYLLPKIKKMKALFQKIGAIDPFRNNYDRITVTNQRGWHPRKTSSSSIFKGWGGRKSSCQASRRRLSARWRSFTRSSTIRPTVDIHPSGKHSSYASSFGFIFFFRNSYFWL